ncbi:MAG: metallophosphoesterase [Capsulimonadaceae bacterium]|nr:metallophosphoesterase [Capsulimonadaceae bacterium]
MSWPLKTAKTLGAIAAGAFVYATGIEPYAIEIVRMELLCPHLPRSFDGFSVLQISDLHMRRFGKRERKIARIAKSLTPDIIALTGDLIHTPAGLQPFLRMCEDFKASSGIYAIYGNSEHKNGIVPGDLARSLTTHGIEALLNRSATIKRGAGTIYVSGVDDPVTHHDDLEAALDGIPAEDFKLLLMHSPDNIPEAVHRNVDLVLSGHTHGGQIRLPIIGPPLTRSFLGRRLNSGHYSGNRLRGLVGKQPGRTQLYVSRGVGISGLALRFLCRPEVALITLRSL